MRTSETIKELAPAVVSFQRQVEPAKKDADNPFFKSKYADIASIYDAIRDPLADNKLAVVQTVERSEQGIINIVSRLIHESGEWMEFDCPMPVTKADPQSIGSVITYGRRYGLQAALGLSAEDDDGNSATHNGASKKPEPEAETPASKHPAIFAKRDYHPSKETGIEAAESLVKDWKCVVCHHRYKTEGDKLIPIPATPLGEMTPKLIGWYYDHFYVPQDGASDEDWKLRAGLNLWKKEHGGD